MSEQKNNKTKKLHKEILIPVIGIKTRNITTWNNAINVPPANLPNTILARETGAAITPWRKPVFLSSIRVIVEKAINDYAKDNDYDLILRADGTTLYAKTYVDITQDIIDKLN